MCQQMPNHHAQPRTNVTITIDTRLVFRFAFTHVIASILGCGRRGTFYRQLVGRIHAKRQQIT